MTKQSRYRGHVCPRQFSRDSREARDAQQIGFDLAPGLPSLEVALQVIVADVVGAPLEQGRSDGNTEGSAHRRQVAPVELILQRLGSRRDNDLAGGQKRRHQIREGLAGAGSSLAHENRAVADRLSDSRGHLQLLRPDSVFRDHRGERTGRAEHRVELLSDEDFLQDSPL
jgi:hypothetical protein